MGRLPKKGVEYFPHDTIAASTPTLFVMQEEFGNDGYAFWFKLLEFLAMKAGHYADFSDRKDWRYFLAKAKVSEELGNKILDTLADLEAIDKELWESHRVVWSDNFIERLGPLYARREDPLPSKPIFEKQTNSDNVGEIKKTNNQDAEHRIGENGGGALTEQSEKFVKPTLEQIAEYCAERGGGVDPQSFYNFYEAKGWKIGNQTMKDWKACVRTWARREVVNTANSTTEVPSKYNREE